MNIRLTLIIILLFSNLPNYGIEISGRVSDSDKKPISYSVVNVLNTPVSTLTNLDGEFVLEYSTSNPFKIVISCLGYINDTIPIDDVSKEKIKVETNLIPLVKIINEINIKAEQDQALTSQRVKIPEIANIPSVSGNIESVIKTLAGVSSNNELSSQYKVRGGSYDENLVYVNGIEVYKPLLIRSGQQEGLSFINPDLVGSIRFFAGGFDASYGDKMSSVLDVTYKKPTTSNYSVSGSFLGATAHYEGNSFNNRLTYIGGMRYKSNSYLVANMDTKGEYNPSFTDFQSLFEYQLNQKIRLSYLIHLGINTYQFFPENRTTSFGTDQNALKLSVFYEGLEDDYFNNTTQAFSIRYKFNNYHESKLLFSYFKSNENISYDILGEYWISQTENRTNTDSSATYHIASFLNHAKNHLEAQVISVGYNGLYTPDEHTLKYGINIQSEMINDLLNEWDLLDSSGYILPVNTNTPQMLNQAYAKNNISSQRLNTYINYVYNLDLENSSIIFNAGIRNSYWMLNNENIISPRFSLVFKPNEKATSFYFSSGYYYQPAFYRELRDRNGLVNKNIRSQKSVQYVIGADYKFKMWDRPFVFATEAYSKLMSNLVPYRADNVRLQYEGKNLANGYALGIDFKLNGEFVENAESWVSLSFLTTKENQSNDQYIDETGKINYPGYYPRQSDQLVNFNLFFQDYLPSNPGYKVHLTMHYGSRLPASIPHQPRYDLNFRIPPYRRVDIGLSKLILGTEKGRTGLINSKYIKKGWINFEIFNLLNIQNTISYTWLKTVNQSELGSGYYGIPNYLTSRRINLKLSIQF